MTITNSLVEALGDDEALARALDYHGLARLDAIGYSIDQAPERNRLRAYWAAVGLTSYREVCKGDTLASSVTDLIADLRHLVAYTGATDDDDPEETTEDVFNRLESTARDRWAEEAYDGE